MANEELDKTNFENMIWFYREELTALYKGVRASELFHKGLRKRLKDYGILIYKHGRSGLRYLLSSTALEMLQTINPTPI
jgi:hypothetical protein